MTEKQKVYVTFKVDELWEGTEVIKISLAKPDREEWRDGYDYYYVEEWEVD